MGSSRDFSLPTSWRMTSSLRGGSTRRLLESYGTLRPRIKAPTTPTNTRKPLSCRVLYTRLLYSAPLRGVPCIECRTAGTLDSPSFFVCALVSLSVCLILYKYGSSCWRLFLMDSSASYPTEYYLITVQCTIVDHEASFFPQPLTFTARSRAMKGLEIDRWQEITIPRRT
ncbi:hypothetical protein F4823DRAFT_592297 [Ustulina deusta]|nr:hypothetical protein F4823DRAFT_592297 [Ustulina deusta]